MLAKLPRTARLLHATRRLRPCTTTPSRRMCTLQCHDCNTATPAPATARAGKAAAFIATCEPALQQVAAALAVYRQPGDCYCLFGAVGAGKSVFSRAFIRAAYEDPELTVPSPTFLLQQIYDECEGPSIHHFDLYRLSGTAADMLRLNLAESFVHAITLVEWAERLRDAGMLPSSRLDVHIEALDQVNNTQQPAGGLQHNQEGSILICSDQQEQHYEQEHDPYTDQRWRRVCLQPHGRQWEQRVQQLLDTFRAKDETANTNS